jgi:hypothetical protein
MKENCDYGLRTLQFSAAGGDQGRPRSLLRPVWMVAFCIVRSRGVATSRLYETKRSYVSGQRTARGLSAALILEGRRDDNPATPPELAQPRAARF